MWYKASRVCGLKALRFHIALNAFKNGTCTLTYAQPKLFPVYPYLMASIFLVYNLLYGANKEETHSTYLHLLLNVKLFSQKHHGVYDSVLEMGMLCDFCNSTVFQVPI